jgi:hypothetical protein
MQQYKIGKCTHSRKCTPKRTKFEQKMSLHLRIGCRKCTEWRRKRTRIQGNAVAIDEHDQQLPVGCLEDRRCGAQQCVWRYHIPAQYRSWVHKVRTPFPLMALKWSFVYEFLVAGELGCCGSCRDLWLVRRIGSATALEVRATGISYTFAPCLAVCPLSAMESLI